MVKLRNKNQESFFEIACVGFIRWGKNEWWNSNTKLLVDSIDAIITTCVIPLPL